MSDSNFDRTSATIRTLNLIVVGEASARAAGLRRCLQKNGHWIVRSVPTIAAAVSTCQQMEEGVIIVDLDDLPEGTLVNLAESAEFGRTIQGLAVLKENDGEVLQNLLCAGFAGAVLRNSTAPVFERALQAVAEGELWAPRKSLASTIRELLAKQNPRKLTSREEEILRLIGRGFKNREIAGELFISRETVRWHLRSINAKLGMHDRGTVAKYAMAIPAKSSSEPDAGLRQRRAG